MQALVKTAEGPGNVELQDIPEPRPEPHQVLIDVAAVGICGTDRLAIEGSHDFHIPRILGHEVSGTIAQLGTDVDGGSLAVGDPVTLETNAYVCGTCRYCKRGEDNRCPNRLAIGTTTDGGLAERIAIRAESVHRLPENITLAEGALVEPLAVSVHAVVEQGLPAPGEVVVVIGPGAIGMLVAQVARAVGATVVLVGRSRHAARMATARALGIPHTLASDETDVEAYVKELTNGDGAQSVYECSGAAGVLEGATDLVRRGGRIVLVAFFRTPPELDIDALINRELELVGARGKRTSSYRTALMLLSNGTVKLGPLIDARLGLSEWEHGLELLAKGEKVVLEPGR